MKKIVLTGITILMILGFQSCSDSKKAKQTTEAKQEVQTSEDAATYSVNVTESKINWLGQTVVTKHQGHILFKSGEINLKEGVVESGSFVADMNTIKSEDATEEAVRNKLDEHLKAEDIFDAAQYPEAKFSITSVKPLEGEYNTELEGNLEIKGISKNLSVKAYVQVEGDKVTLKTEKFTINRQDFNVTYSNGNPQDKVIKDLFDIEIIITANKK
ncbi:MAG: YceI family protein [Flavobacteriaceae bacterium]|jgi:polyisoprenoid-binding protein YceI|nr:YceI family protein [Flavobacteriaceae bacterium]